MPQPERVLEEGFAIVYRLLRAACLPVAIGSKLRKKAATKKRLPALSGDKSSKFPGEDHRCTSMP
jgi:hypothetical protein